MTPTEQNLMHLIERLAARLFLAEARILLLEQRSAVERGLPLESDDGDLFELAGVTG